MIDWKTKLSSRKLWLAVVELVSGLLLIFGVSESQVSQICGVIMSLGSVIGYLIAEGLTDSARAKSDTSKEGIG